MSVTADEIRDMWVEARVEIEAIAKEVIGEFMRPDLEAQLALAALTMPPDVRANVPPEVMQELLEVFNARSY